LSILKDLIALDAAQVWARISADVNLWRTREARKCDARLVSEIDEFSADFRALDYDFYVRGRLPLAIKYASDYAEELYGQCCESAEAHHLGRERVFYTAAFEYCIKPFLKERGASFDGALRAYTLHQFARDGILPDAGATIRMNEIGFDAAFAALISEWRARIEMDARKADRDTVWDSVSLLGIPEIAIAKIPAGALESTIAPHASGGKSPRIASKRESGKLKTAERDAAIRRKGKTLMANGASLKEAITAVAMSRNGEKFLSDSTLRGIISLKSRKK
jgi:hypothetical protein